MLSEESGDTPENEFCYNSSTCYHLLTIYKENRNLYKLLDRLVNLVTPLTGNSAIIFCAKNY